MLAEFICEILESAATELLANPRVPKIVRFIVASVILIPLTVLAFMLIGTVESTAGKLAIGAAAAVLLLLYLISLRRIIRS